MSPKTRAFWQTILPSPSPLSPPASGGGRGNRFYLAGGTGAALHLGHRTSEDFDFFTPQPFSLLAPLTDWRGVQVAALLDIGLMKLTAVSSRSSRKDFVDLYAICQAGLPLTDLLARWPEKYGPAAATTYHLLRSLTYGDDADAEPDLRMTAPLDWAAVKTFFQAEARRLF